MKALELRIPPAVVTALFLFSMWGAKKLFPLWSLNFPYSKLLQWGLWLAAAAVCIAATLELWRVRTTANPMDPSRTSTLVRSGVYRISRNPIYLGFLLMVLAMSVRFSNLPALLLIPPYIAWMTRLQIIPEERVLQRLFGTEYRTYCRQVRRWI